MTSVLLSRLSLVDCNEQRVSGFRNNVKHASVGSPVPATEKREIDFNRVSEFGLLNKRTVCMTVCHRPVSEGSSLEMLKTLYSVYSIYSVDSTGLYWA